MESKFVNEFKVGDGIRLYGFEGTVTKVDHMIIYVDECGAKRDPMFFPDTTPIACTYLTVNFDHPEVVGYQYEGATYGGLNNVVAYGYFAR